jgi:hypothetical protein
LNAISIGTWSIYRKKRDWWMIKALDEAEDLHDRPWERMMELPVAAALTLVLVVALIQPHSHSLPHHWLALASKGYSVHEGQEV